MSFLFGRPAPAPQPVPVSPVDSGEAERARQEAARAAQAERVSAGRRSTIVAGQQIAMDDQQGVGLLSRSRRAASEMVG